MPLKHAFQSKIVLVDISKIIQIKVMTSAYRKSATYLRIAASVAHVGIIEPVMVFPLPTGKYLLLDGHTRLDILIATGIQTANCLFATDNESYTYNKRVNFIPPIAQHYMILRALAHVSEERIASALNVTVGAIREKRDLLKGICPETAEILRNERVGASAFSALRRMKPVRQIDVARLMISAKKFTGRFARAMLNGTREELLVSASGPSSRHITPSQKSMMELETDDLLKHVDSIKANYGEDVLNLTAACKYVEKLLADSRVHRYLTKHHAETLASIVQVLEETAVDKKRGYARQKTEIQPEQPSTSIALKEGSTGSMEDHFRSSVL